MTFSSTFSGWRLSVAGLLLFPVASPLTAQAFDYVHGGVGYRCESAGDDKAWFSFDGGVIRYTTDGGTTILNANVPDTVRGTLRGLHMSRDLQGPYGYCVGENGVVLYSTDWGQSWTQLPLVLTAPVSPVNPNVPAALWDVWFIDRLHGFVVGFDHTLMETQDGGQTWQDIAPMSHISADNPEWYQLHGFANGEFMAVADEGWLVRRLANGVMQPKKLDETFWCYLPQLASQPWDLEIWAIDFVGDVGLAVGGVGNNDGYIFRSSDRGATWTLDSPCYAFLNGVGINSTPPSFYGVELFDDPSRGVVVGYGSGTFVGGPSSVATPPTGCPGCAPGSKAWTQVVSDSDQNMTVDPEDDIAKPLLRDICSSGPRQVSYSLGDFGVVRRSDDQGQTWTELAGLHRGRIQCGAFADPQIGVIAGQLWRVYSTVTGGQEFSLDYMADIPINPSTGIRYSGNFQDVAIADDGGRAVVVGDRGRVHVRDAQGNWLDRSIGTWANGPDLTSALTVGSGLPMVLAGEGGMLYVSPNGGVSGFFAVPLTYLGVPVTTKIIDFTFDGTFLYYLTQNNRVYVSFVGALTDAQVFAPIQGSTGVPTCIGARSLANFYVGNNKGELFFVDLPSITLQPVAQVAPVQLGRYAFGIEPVPGSLEWWFAGAAGQVVYFDGAAFSTPKSSIADNIVDVSFFNSSEGVLIGRKTNIATW